MENEVEFYAELLELLGGKPTVKQLRVLSFINVNRRFSVPDLVDALNVNRVDIYPIIQNFERKGLIEKIPQPELPEDAHEWSTTRRRSYKKRVGITRRDYYEFKPKGIVKVIDRKITQLKAMRTQLLEEKG